MDFKLDQLPAQTGKIAIVTGANTGLGYETAVHLAQKGIKVIMACRSQDKAIQAKSAIESKVPGAELDILLIDLTDLAAVRTFAAAFRAQYDRLDFLINNAGIMFPPYTQTVDGFESQMGANYFGHFLLTALLLDRMPDTLESRVVSLSSNAHKAAANGINFDDLQSEKQYSKMGAYAQSKLACLMFGNQLQRRLAQAGKQVRSVTAHPGVSETELARHMPQYQIQLIRYTIGAFIAHPPEQASLPTVMAALDPAAQGGEYFGPQGWLEMTGKPGRAQPSHAAQDPVAAAKLWTLSEQLTEKRFRSDTPIYDLSALRKIILSSPAW
ncbi:SDR family NAD(P)-dependent oxidoreductase [filamentous cyanobacterium LEGE 11480]|uniref:SDR family NAD(P)-dependent oxidoreductase n=1 Tax=Romeriopsis navalis LEGE 11480 TaxID=2777977 RepID=A0A928VMJ2_9CYAN|nr:oxidoreductase [Romeriopsis navalis]MBE9030357.1 SDR family NAD(P)-dependent oxidoreductase [Romeriopsis navalis LEGE 11480]